MSWEFGQTLVSQAIQGLDAVANALPPTKDVSKAYSQDHEKHQYEYESESESESESECKDPSDSAWREFRQQQEMISNRIKDIQNNQDQSEDSSELPTLEAIGRVVFYLEQQGSNAMDSQKRSIILNEISRPIESSEGEWTYALMSSKYNSISEIVLDAAESRQETPHREIEKL